MTHKNLKTSINEVYSKPPKKDYATNKTDVYHIDDIWSLDILNLNDYGFEDIRGYRYVLVVFDNFSKFGWTVPLKNTNAQTIKDCFKSILISSKREPNWIKTDDGSEFVNKLVTFLLNSENINRYSKYTSLGAVFAERFNRTVRDLFKRPVFERRDPNWVDALPTIMKQ